MHVVVPDEANIEGTWAYDNQVVLIVVAIVAALVGIMFGWLVYQKRRIPAFEPTLFANGWYYDQTITRFMGGPGRKSFEAIAAFDSTVVDGAVNGVATGVRGTAGELRKGQTGYVRQYGLVIAIGTVLLLGWFFLRGVL